MNNYEFLKIAELVKSGEASLQTGPFGTQLKASDYVEHGVPVINVRNIGFGDIRQDNLEFLNEVMAEKMSAHKLKRGDIVFGRKGAVERHAFIKDVGVDWIQGSDCLRLRINSDRIDNRFISYFFKTNAHQDWMQAVCSFGATMASLNQDIVKLITIPLPLLDVQRKIAGILSAYDDLIENNKRRIALLESMAEELYREWFVRFRFPGWREAEFEKGIPKGWEVRVLSDLADINKSNLRQNAAQGSIEYVDIGSVTTNHIDETTTYAIADAPGRARRKVKHGDIIWSSVRPANRAYALIFNPHKNLIVSTGFAVISPKDHYYYPFLLKATTTNSYVDQITAVAKGAAYPATSFEDFEKSKILTPEYQLVKQYYELINPIFEQIHLLGKKNKNLQETKNALLPRLISGKLAVEDLAVQLPPSMREVRS